MKCHSTALVIITYHLAKLVSHYDPAIIPQGVLHDTLIKVRPIVVAEVITIHLHQQLVGPGR